MYKVYIDGVAVHDPGIDDPAALIVDGVIKKSANVADLFTFTAEPGSRAFEAVNKLTSVIEVYKDQELLFRGRATKSSETWTGATAYECEGWFAVFNDTIMRPYDYTGSVRGFVQQVINQHNAQVPASKQFTLRTVTVTDPNDTIVRSSSDYSTTMQVLQDKLAGSALGGYLVVEYTGGKWYLDYLADGTGSSGQKITIAKNLIDFLREQNAESIATGIVPLGAKDEETGERLTIKSVNDGKDYITDAEAAARYGLIFTTQVWDDVTVASNLLTKAQEALSDYTAIIPNITLTAVDLSIMDQDIDPIRFLDYVTVEDDRHDASGRYLVMERTYNISAPERDQVVFGGSRPAISNASAKVVSEVENVEETIISSVLERAREIAKAVLESSTDGNIYFRYNNDGRIYEIDILDTDNPETATRMWRWNLGGFGYSGNGGDTYTTAITMDGAIVADFITAGTLNANIVKAGVLKSREDGTNPSFYLDLDNGILRGKFSELSISGQTVNQISQNVLDSFVNNQYASDIEELHNQIDGQIDTYFYNYVPTLNNAPASSWTTTALREDHVGDLFYVIDNPDHAGEAYRFIKSGSTFKWQLLSDDGIAVAIQQAQEAYALAGAKKRVFTSTPTTPYEVGDLWASGTDLYRCTTARATGSYRSSDWSLATNYIDSADASNLINTYDSSLNQLAVFNKLTNNGTEQGIYLSNNKVYINGTYIKAGTIDGDLIQARTIDASKITVNDLEAFGATIGGWQITSTQLRKYNSARTMRVAINAPSSPGNNSGAFLVADESGSSTTYPFIVRYDGSLTATKATITGDITANTGKVGGFIIDGTSIHADDLTSTANGAIALSKSNFSRSIGGTSRSSLRFAIGGDFAVSTSGVLYATNAVLKGSLTTANIKATGGEVGGFNIDGTSIRSGALTSTASGAIGLSTVDFTRSINGTSRTDLRFAIGSRFGVSTTGVLYASDATISGSITVTSGQIGRFTISPTYLYTGSGSTQAGMGGNQAFWAGATQSNSAPFRVAYDGTVVATKATITGAINAGSGAIGGWKINSSSLSKDYTADSTISPTTASSYNTTLQRVLLGTSFPTATQYINFDITGDGNLNSTDLAVFTTAVNNNRTISISNSYTSTINASNGRITVSANYSASMTGYSTTGARSTTIMAGAISTGGVIAHDGYFSNQVSTNKLIYSSQIAASDRRLKNDIIEMDDEYGKALADLKPCLYKLKHDTEKSIRYGLIAQDVKETILNDVISGDDYLSINYIDLIAVLIKGWQIHEKRINKLEGGLQ